MKSLLGLESLVPATIATLAAMAALVLGAKLKGDESAPWWKTVGEIWSHFHPPMGVLVFLVVLYGILLRFANFFIGAEPAPDPTRALFAAVATNTPAGTAKEQGSPTPTRVDGPGPFPTVTPTCTCTPTATNTPTATPTSTPTPTSTATNTPTSTPTPTATNTPTSTPTPTSTIHNTAPVLDPIGNLSVAVGHLLTFTVNAQDEEGNAPEFSLSGAPSGASIDPHTGTFSWIPNSTGAFNVTVIVTETDGHPTNLSDDEAITITVVPPPLPTPPTIPLRSECQRWDYFYFHFLNLKPQGVLDLTRSTDDALQIEITDPKLGEYIIRYHPLDSPVKLAMEEWPIIWQCEEPGVSCRKDVDKDQKAIYVDWEWLRKDMTSGWYSLVLQVFDKGNWHCVELMPIYIKVPEGH